MIKFFMRPVPNLWAVNKGIMKLLSAFSILFKMGGLDEKKASIIRE